MMFRNAVLLLMATAIPAAAALAGDAPERAMAPFAACRAIADPAQRASCYDRAYDGLRARMASGDVVISDAAHRQAAFGLPSLMPRRSRAAGPAAPVPLGQDAIDSTILATRPYGPDAFVFQLADGGVWRTADASADPHFPRGTKVHLKRVSFGGILLVPERGPQLKVIRVR